MNNTVKDYEKLSEQYNKMIAERNSLIDDLSWYKAKVSRLERENEQLKESHIKHITNMENYYKDRLQKLKEKNGELQEFIEGKNSDLLFTEDEIIQLEKDLENKHNLLSEISQHIGNKPSSSTYKYFRAKLDNLNITEDKQND
ncbi:hypothetical protein [Staphylococcus saprophyticus]|uniref:hypothetical protein n=1 Tax=Staphylococcus saprophyticus TaxID=29385 RepID=UPI000565DAB9|nr:hypothetical protein [Staphylococcus saprophyticus]